MINVIRKQIRHEEFDYQSLLYCLKDYSYPRDKISALLRGGEIIRVKKGLYIFGEEHRNEPFSREILANLIYGPSYISLEYALHHHGMIPERSEAVTSVTVGRHRKYSTPVGLFIYRRVPMEAYRTGMNRIETSGGRAFLMASPEKALADKIQDDRGTGIRTQKEVLEYLEKSLRVESATLKELNPNYLEEVAVRYRSRKIRLLANLIRRLRK